MRDIIEIDDIRDVFVTVREQLAELNDCLDEISALTFCRNWWQLELDRHVSENETPETD